MLVNKITSYNSKIQKTQTNDKLQSTSLENNNKRNKGTKLTLALLGLATIGIGAVYISKASQGKTQNEAESQMVKDNLERLKRLTEEEAKYKTEYDRLQKQADKLIQKAIKLSQ